MALIVTLGLGLSTFLGTVNKNVLGYATSMTVSDLWQGTNNQRTSNGLGSLALNDQLISAAQAKANDMAARDYWSHNTPEGNPPWVFFDAAGYSYEAAGENLAYGFDTSDAAITGWMNSPGHRANILNGVYTEVGFATANSANYQGTGPETIVVAMYAKPQVASAVAAAPSTPAPQPAATPTPAPTPIAQETPPAAAEPAAETPVETNTTVVATEEGVKDDSKAVEASSVSRIQLLTSGAAPWSMFAASVLAAIALAIFIIRHGLFWHRFLRKGERFIIKHKALDITLVLVVVVGFVLTRTAGVIH